MGISFMLVIKFMRASGRGGIGRIILIYFEIVICVIC